MAWEEAIVSRWDLQGSITVGKILECSCRRILLRYQDQHYIGMQTNRGPQTPSPYTADKGAMGLLTDLDDDLRR